MERGWSVDGTRMEREWSLDETMFARSGVDVAACRPLCPACSCADTPRSCQVNRPTRPGPQKPSTRC